MVQGKVITLHEKKPQVSFTVAVKLNHLHQLSSNQNFTANLTARQKDSIIFLCNMGGVKVESGILCFTLEKQINEITSPYTSPWFLSQKAADFMGLQHLNNTTRECRSHNPLHFGRCTMTALRRFACCSVLLSSDSSLLGKVVIRTKSMAAIEGWAAITKCRTSDTLKKARQIDMKQAIQCQQTASPMFYTIIIFSQVFYVLLSVNNSLIQPIMLN